MRDIFLEEFSRIESKTTSERELSTTIFLTLIFSEPLLAEAE